MVYGVLLVLLDMSLMIDVVKQPLLPDVALLVLVPLAIIGGHLVSNGKAVYQLALARRDQQTVGLGE